MKKLMKITYFISCFGLGLVARSSGMSFEDGIVLLIIFIINQIALSMTLI